MKKWKEKRKWHINIILMFFHHFFDKINYSMRNTFLHDHYIYLKFRKNKIIGLLSIINSTVCLIISPIVGYYCDKYKNKRKKGLQIISVSYLLVNIIHYMFIRTNSLILIIFVTALSKMLHECCHVITESIFIESIDKGKKSLIFTYQKLISTVATTLGPFFCLILFYLYNDIWNIKNIFIIFQFSILSILPQTFISFLWENDNIDVIKNTEEIDLIAKKKDQKNICCFSTYHIPYIVFISHIITLAGAGMTFKYFSLFLKTEYKVSPMSMCILNIVIPVLLSIFTYVSQKLSKTLGRAQVSLFFTSIGFLLLCSLSYIHNYKDVLKVHVLRSVFQNCTNPVDKSILYDFIDTKRDTGKWMGVQSLYYLVWSISAYFGGWLSDISSYRNTFKITTFFYLVSLIIYTPLLWLVPIKETV
ncbi:metabolite/drug transporter, putative [Plasmodium relictum]|uniref:Metabolite/drug transporter, putative n=1 Tax=Plasmodium relictum TaxID=85471 RepID=A0A1J1H4S0_PLARL|nr:metabolite/drug transporter, putative [Plasmodium relictum]CRG99924.1 metabolite/drug transporter, putative [Plasmodium relictum]